MNEELKNKAVLELISLQNQGDKEMRHVYADDVLCSLLKDLGYSEVVEEYNKIDKWFA
jgi:hypothetical protein